MSRRSSPRYENVCFLSGLFVDRYTYFYIHVFFFKVLYEESETESFSQFHGKLNLSWADLAHWRSELFRLLCLLSEF